MTAAPPLPYFFFSRRGKRLGGKVQCKGLGIPSGHITADLDGVPVILGLACTLWQQGGGGGCPGLRLRVVGQPPFRADEGGGWTARNTAYSWVADACCVSIQGHQDQRLVP